MLTGHAARGIHRPNHPSTPQSRMSSGAVIQKGCQSVWVHRQKRVSQSFVRPIFIEVMGTIFLFPVG